MSEHRTEAYVRKDEKSRATTVDERACWTRKCPVRRQKNRPVVFFRRLSAPIRVAQ